MGMRQVGPAPTGQPGELTDEELAGGDTPIHDTTPSTWGEIGQYLGLGGNDKNEAVIIPPKDAIGIMNAVALAFSKTGYSDQSAYQVYDMYASQPAYKALADIGKERGLADYNLRTSEETYEKTKREEDKQHRDRMLQFKVEAEKRANEKWKEFVARQHKNEQRRTDTSTIAMVKDTLNAGVTENAESGLRDEIKRRKDAGLITDEGFSAASSLLDTRVGVRKRQDSDLAELAKAAKEKRWDDVEEMYYKLSVESANDKRLETLLRNTRADEKHDEAKRDREARDAAKLEETRGKEDRARQERIAKQQVSAEMDPVKQAGIRVANNIGTPEELDRDKKYLANAQSALHTLQRYAEAGVAVSPQIAAYALQQARSGVLGEPNRQAVPAAVSGAQDVAQAFGTYTDTPIAALPQKTGHLLAAPPPLSNYAAEIGVSPYTALGNKRSLESLRVMAAQQHGLLPIPTLTGGREAPSQGFYRQEQWGAGSQISPSAMLPAFGEPLHWEQNRGGGGGQSAPSLPEISPFQVPSLGGVPSFYGPAAYPEVGLQNPGVNPIDYFAPTTGVVNAGWMSPQAFPNY